MTGGALPTTTSVLAALLGARSAVDDPGAPCGSAYVSKGEAGSEPSSNPAVLADSSRTLLKSQSSFPRRAEAILPPTASFDRGSTPYSLGMTFFVFI